jgi:3-deoxy-D-manno-octulosonic-acid transferase
VWIAASTHAGEEAGVLEAHVKLLERYPGALLIVAPRHPERAANVARQCRGRGLSCRFSSESSPGEAAVLIVDQLGVLARHYAVAEVAFVGGSLVSKGGHNPLEALVAGTPVISGPHVDNFADIYVQLQHAGAAAGIDSAEALAEAVAAWFADGRARDRAVSAGQEIVAGYRGALERVLALVDPGR